MSEETTEALTEALSRPAPKVSALGLPRAGQVHAKQIRGAPDYPVQALYPCGISPEGKNFWSINNLGIPVGVLVRTDGIVSFAPAAIPYDSTYAIADYIERAGGFTDRAKRKSIVVVQGGTGKSVKASRITRISPGDKIFVPAKTPVDGWRIFRETLVVLTQVATLIILVRSVRN